MKPVKENNKKTKVLVVGVGGPAGINVSKILFKYRKDFEIYGVEIPGFSAVTKFLDHFSIYPKDYDEKIIIPWYEKYIKKNKIDVVIQTVAEALVLMDTLQKKIGDKTKILISPLETITLCHEKDKLYKFIDENLPELICKWQKLDKFPNWKSEEYFIKPIVGRGARGCRKVSKNELKFLIKDQKEIMKKFIAMEVLPGREWTVDAYVNNDGSISYLIPRLRLALSGGISSAGKTDKNKVVIDQTKKVLGKISCRGPVFVQWKEDVGGKIKMVEINPRASGGLSITAIAGGNMGESILAEIKGHPICNKKWKEVKVVRYFEELEIKK